MRLRQFSAACCVLAAFSGCKTPVPSSGATLKDDGPTASAGDTGPSVWVGYKRDTADPAVFAKAVADAKASLSDAAVLTAPPPADAAASRPFLPDVVLVRKSRAGGATSPLTAVWSSADVARSGEYAVVAVDPNAAVQTPDGLATHQAQVLVGNAADVAGSNAVVVAHTFQAGFDGQTVGQMVQAHTDMMRKAGLPTYAFLYDRGYFLELTSSADAASALAKAWDASPLKAVVDADGVVYSAAQYQ